MIDRYAILLDGEYVRKTLGKRLRRPAGTRDVLAEVARLRSAPALAGLYLYRVFYYSADPLGGGARHPLTGATIDFAATSIYRLNNRLLEQLEGQADFAVRRGILAHQGWKLGDAAVRRLLSGSMTDVQPADVVPRIQQKGVDMRIGLDIASLALKRLVSTIVLVTGDSDLVPAMKFARREGLRVLLDALGSPFVRVELRAHADMVIGSTARPVDSRS